MFIRSATKTETKTYSWRPVDRYQLESFLTERPSSDGAFGLEWVCDKEKSNVYFFYNELIKSEIMGSSIFKSVISCDNPICYYLAPSRAVCFPFSFEYHDNIIDKLDKTISGIIENESVFMQIILQKKSDDEWRRELSQMYVDYLNGIEIVTTIPLIRSIQYKALDFIKKKEEWIGGGTKVPYATHKFHEEGFDVSIRLLVSGGSRYSHEKLFKRAQLVMSELNYSNQWILRKAFNKDKFIKQVQLRQISRYGVKTLLCLPELLPFFADYTISDDILDDTVVSSQVMVDNTVPLDNKENHTTSRLSFKLPSLEYLPRGNVEAHEQDVLHFDNMINETLEKIGLLHGKRVSVTEVKQGATVRKITISLPQGINYSQFNEKVVKDIRSHLGKKTSVVMGNAPNTVDIGLPLDKRAKVYLRDLIDTDEFREFIKKNPLPVIVGVSETGELILACLTKMPHLLGAGATGSGKSVWLNVLLVTLLLTKSPDEVSIYIIDPKQVEFIMYKGIPHVKKVVTDSEQATPLLDSLIAEMERRYALFAKAGCRNIAQYNKKSSKPLKYLVCIVDEFSDLVGIDPEVKECVLRLGQLARASGIHLIVATQRPSVNIIDGDIKAQLPTRISFKCASRHDYSTVLDKKPPYELLGRGDGVALGFEGAEDLTRFQGALLADDEESTDKVIESVKKEWEQILNGVHIAVDDLPEVKRKPVPTILDRAKMHICNGGKVTQREMAKTLEIRYENVKEILEKLVEEKWLESPVNSRSGYKVIIGREEIETFGKWYCDKYESDSEMSKKH